MQVTFWSLTGTNNDYEKGVRKPLCDCSSAIFVIHSKLFKVTVLSEGTLYLASPFP